MLNDILIQLGATTVVVGIAGYLLKTWIAHQLEGVKAEHAHELAVKLEHTRAEVAKEVARLSVHESYLHKRRVELLEEMHAAMIEAEFSLQQFLVSWWARSNKAELVEGGYLPPGHFDDKASEPFEKRGVDFCESYLKINATLHRNAMFFEDAFIEGVRSAYQPFFDTILALDYNDPPAMPDAYKDVVNAGRAPRRDVIDKFRAILGVAPSGQGTSDNV